MIELALLVLVTGIAFWRGRPPEKWAAAALIMAAVISPLVESLHAPHSVNLPILTVDGVLAGALTFIAIRYAHWWTIGAAGTALFEFMIHGAAMARTGIPNHAYFVALEASSDVIILAVGAGVLAATRPLFKGPRLSIPNARAHKHRA